MEQTNVRCKLLTMFVMKIGLGVTQKRLNLQSGLGLRGGLPPVSLVGAGGTHIMEVFT